LKYFLLIISLSIDSIGWCVSKIAALLQALVRASARVACKCAAMWVGLLFLFCGGEEKKQNKFPSNLHCPFKKLNPFLFQVINIISVSCVCLFTLVANGCNMKFWAF